MLISIFGGLNTIRRHPLPFKLVRKNTTHSRASTSPALARTATLSQRSQICAIVSHNRPSTWRQLQFFRVVLEAPAIGTHLAPLGSLLRSHAWCSTFCRLMRHRYMTTREERDMNWKSIGIL